MLIHRKVTLLATAVLMISVAVLLWINPGQLGSSHVYAHSKKAVIAQKKLSNDTVAQGPYKVQGNAVVGANGQRYLFHGVSRDGLEFDCLGDGHFDAQELAYYMGSGTNTATTTYWDANTVWLPLSEAM
jgi:endoglucanase